MKSIQHGFSFIELLIVITVMGIMGSVIIIVINPTERLAQARDSQRRAAIKQLSQAMTSYAITNNGYILNNVPTWQTTLKNAGLIKQEITLPASRINCTLSNQGNVCKYTFSASVSSLEAVVESKRETVKAGGVCATDPVTNYAAIMWLSNLQKVGLRCMGTNVNSWGPSDNLVN